MFETMKNMSLNHEIAPCRRFNYFAFGTQAFGMTKFPKNFTVFNGSHMKSYIFHRKTRRPSMIRRTKRAKQHNARQKI